MLIVNIQDVRIGEIADPKNPQQAEVDELLGQNQAAAFGKEILTRIPIPTIISRYPEIK
jgi:hypothetical protein